MSGRGAVLTKSAIDIVLASTPVRVASSESSALSLIVVSLPV